MDPISIVAIAALIGYSIFKDTPEKKAARERAEQERFERENQRRIQQNIREAEERKQREILEAEERERKRPFNTSKECFQEQYVSYARISTYNTCPNRFKIIYLDKKSENLSRCDTLHTSKGKIFHATMEGYFKRYIGRIITTLDYKEIIEEAKWDIKELPIDKRKTFRKNVRFLCKTFPTNAEIIAVEQELSFKVNDIKFYGIVDLVLKYPDGHYEIVDFKTGLISPIKEQLEIYSIPFAYRTDHLPITYRFICVDRESHYIWSNKKEKRDERTNNILNIVNTIVNDTDFLPMVSSYCVNCSVNQECKYSKEYHPNGIQRRPSNKRLLTRLRQRYEWKPGQKMPKSMNYDYKMKKEKLPGISRGNGRSFSLSKAKKEYICLKTKRIIRKDEYHFVDHKCNRYCIDAFMELYPDRANKLLEKVISQTKGDKGLSFSLSKAKEDHRCLEYLPSCKPMACYRCCTQRVIKKEEYHFVNHKGMRYCIDAFKELYPERADSLIKRNITF